MTSFDYIVAIYNPNSTNNAEQKAKHFKKRAADAGYKVVLQPTGHRGHAVEIAKKVVKEYTRPLLISVSGDGGYNELINGVLTAKHGTKKEPVVAIIAAGNANDHKRTTRGDTPLLTLVKRGNPRPLDLLHLDAGKVQRYAHSYIGFGITPDVGIELNKHDLNRFLEIILVLRSFASFTPFRIHRDGSEQAYANLIFANVSSMSKVLKLDTAANTLRDGKFEVIADEWKGKMRLLLHLLKLVIVGHQHAPKFTQYQFTTVDPLTYVQLDGEIEKISKNTTVTITAKQAALLSLY